MTYIRIICIFLFLLPSCGVNTLFMESEKPSVEIREGAVDLEGVDLERTGYVRISGEAEFYWNRLYAPDDFRKGSVDVKPHYLPVPSSWTSIRHDGRNLPAEGFGTYRFFVKTSYKGSMALVLGIPNSAYRVWINDTLAGGAGELGDSSDYRPAKISRVHEFSAAGEDLTVTVQVSNYTYFQAGLTELLFVGLKDALHERQMRRMSTDLFLFGVFIVIVLFNLAIFAIRRRDMAPLWFALFTLLVAVRVLLTNEVFLSFLYPGISCEALRTMEFLTVSLGGALFIEFLSTLFPDDSNRYINALFYTAAGAYSFLILATPVMTFSRFLPWYHLVYVGAGLYMASIYLRAFFRKRERAYISFTGFVVLFATVVNDMLSANFIINTYLMLQIGFLFFIVAQSMSLTVGFSRAFSRVEDLSESLEKKVRERTRELEQERNRFKKRNDLLEKELRLARKIQQQLIPHPWPTAYIASVYKPMEQVGGDFYDFLKFRNSNSIGIFLSDVSGHGVPAAFITSMVKTIILQSGPKREEPALLLSYLNDLLINQTGENFITALYAIFDPESRVIRYASAGHHAPLIIGDNGVRQLTGRRGIPLAVLDSTAQERRGKTYVANEAVLEKGDRILFFTDGLTEATHRDDMTRYFDDEILEKTLMDLRGTSCRDFVDTLMEELVRFHGSDRFEDDICLICLDVM